MVRSGTQKGTPRSSAAERQSDELGRLQSVGPLRFQEDRII